MHKLRRMSQVSCFMLQEILSSVTGLIVYVISSLGYPGIILLMAVQTVAIPMPSEVIIPFAGFLASTGRFNLWLIAFCGGLGSTLGGCVAYWIGFAGGRPLVEKYGRKILISHHDLDLADRFFARYGGWALFFGQLLPVVRSFICFPAGISRLPLKKFVASVFVGSFLWSLGLGYLGFKLGQHWSDLHNQFQKFDGVIVVAIILAAAWWVWRHLKNRAVDQKA